MGSRVTTWALEAIGIADERFKIEDIAANTAAALTSDYTEASPQPGQAVARDTRSSAVPMVHGAQSADLELVALRGGMPGVAEIGYRAAGAADTAVVGWQTPGQLVRWETAQATTTASIVSWASAVLPSGHVVLFWNDDTAGAIKCATWTPSTQTLGAAVTVASLGTTGNAPGVSAIGLPSGRVICWASGDRKGWSWYSDDLGATWAVYAVRQDERAASKAGPPQVSGACYSAGQICMVQCQSGATDVFQMASSDLCQSIDYVYTLAGADNPWCVALPDGSILVGYRKTSDSKVYCRRIGAAYGSLGDVEEVKILDSAIDECRGVMQEDGSVWAYIRAGAVIYPMLSTNRGLTWVAAQGVTTTDSSTYPRLRSAQWSCGQAVMVGDAAATPGTQDLSAWVSVWGQWTNATIGAYDLTAQVEYTDLSPVLRGTIGFDLAYFGGLDLPQNVGWARTSSGTSSQQLVGSGTVIQTGAGTDYYDIAQTAAQSLHCRWQVYVTTGGSTTTSDCVMRMRASTGASVDYRLDVRMSTTAFRLYDINAGTPLAAAVSFDMVNGFEGMAEIDPVTGYCQMFYRAIGGGLWTSAGSYTLTSATLSTAAVTFGHVNSATCSSAWKMVLASTFSGSTQRYRLGIDGSGLPLAAIPMATHDYGATLQRMALSLASGPARPREVWDVEARPLYPIEGLDLRLTGTPRRRWRSTDEDDVYIVWDLGSAQQLGTVALAFPVFNGNGVDLQSSTGGGWTTRIAASATVGSSATWTATGSLLTLGGAISGRYVQRGELVGGTVLFTTSGEVRRITANTGGYLGATGAGDLIARLTVEGLTGAETGTAVVRAPRLMEIRDVTTSARYWRLRMTKGVLVAATHEGYWEAVGGVFRCVPMAGPAWGSVVHEVAPQVDRVTDRQGGTYQRRRGNSVRSWTSHWQDGRWAGQHRDESSSNGSDYVSLATSGEANALNDIAFALAGLVDVGAELPWISVHNATQGLDTTDRSRWIVGYLDGTVSMGIAMGDEGSDAELVRVEAITITEYA